MKEFANGSGQEGRENSAEFEFPSFEKLFKPARAEAREALPVLDFQEPFKGQKVPKRERVTREDFASLVGETISANPELIQIVSGGDEYGESISRTIEEENGRTSIEIGYLEYSDGIRHNVTIITPNGEGESKGSNYYSGNTQFDTDWVQKSDQPVSVYGHIFKGYVSGGEVEALGGFIRNKFDIDVPNIEDNQEGQL
jgi:hypothetical protein